MSFREMHIDPEKSWDKATAAITQQAAQLQALETDGIPLRPKDIEGGLDGVRYGYDALFPEFRRCQWKSVDGKPIGHIVTGCDKDEPPIPSASPSPSSPRVDTFKYDNVVCIIQVHRHSIFNCCHSYLLSDHHR